MWNTLLVYRAQKDKSAIGDATTLHMQAPQNKQGCSMQQQHQGCEGSHVTLKLQPTHPQNSCTRHHGGMFSADTLQHKRTQNSIDTQQNKSTALNTTYPPRMRVILQVHPPQLALPPKQYPIHPQRHDAAATAARALHAASLQALHPVHKRSSTPLTPGQNTLARSDDKNQSGGDAAAGNCTRPPCRAGHQSRVWGGCSSSL